MAKCTQDWEDCSGFFGCIIPAITTAAKCTASYIEDNTTKAASYHRKAMYNAVNCVFDKYLAGKLTATEASKAIGGYTSPVGETYTEYSVGFENWTDKNGLAVFPNKWLFGAPATAIVNQTREFFLHAAGQANPPNHTGTVAEQGVWANLPVIGDMFIKESQLFTQVRFGGGPCPQFGKDDQVATVKKMLWSYFSAVATLGGGQIKAAYEAAKMVTAGTPKEVVMQALFSLIEDAPPGGLGLTIPDPVKNFLTCLYTKAGAKAIEAVKLGLVDGKYEDAGKLIAPYIVDCGAETLKDELPEDSPFKALVNALALAVTVYLAPEPAAPPKPAPKVPVTDPALACKQAGNVYFDTTKQCLPLSAVLGAAQAAPQALKLVTTVTPETVAAAAAERKRQEQEQQRQLLTLAGIAVVAYLALS